MARKRTGFHIVPVRIGGERWWRLFYADAPKRAPVTVRVQTVAIELGRMAARKAKTSLRLHGRDGRIRWERSFGNETKRPG